MNVRDWRGVWVLMERRDGRIHPVSFELLSKGRLLRDSLAEGLTAVFYGDVETAQKRDCGNFGADEILCLAIDSRYGTSCEVMAELLSVAAREKKPSILLAGATMFGRTVMPLTAVRLGTGLTADCTELEIDEEKRLLLQTRPAFGGNILATIVCPDSRPQMATVRPRVFRAAKGARRGAGRVVDARYALSGSRVVEVLETIVEGEETDITESDIIVAGGRGLGKSEGFGLLEKLARLIGGVVGASRGAVDLGWISPAHQVGQTGHTVNPKLYVACGISGAIQHIAGMKGSEVIIGINEDPEAPIFQVADYGIVGDLYEVIPRILDELKNGAKA